VNHVLRSFPSLTGGVQGTSVPMLWWFDREGAADFPARYKIIAFGILSFFAGVAGAMYAFKAAYITIDPPFK